MSSKLNNSLEKIHWAPKVRQARVWALYQSDGRGTLDDELVNQVGYALLARCESIVMIRDGLVDCPRCGTRFTVRRFEGWSSSEMVTCPKLDCGWQTSGEIYHQSFRHQELWIGKAGPAFDAFLADFPRRKTSQERMLAIDQLLHAFHWDLLAQMPNRPAANNLIEGSVEEVVAMLDRLSFGNDETRLQKWRESVSIMMGRRKGTRYHS